MASLEENLKKILLLLLRSSEFVTLDYLSEQVGMSKRSVQNYLSKIESYLSENNLTQTEITRKRGNGIQISASVEDRRKIERLLHFKSLNIHYGDAKRRFEILKLLMFSEDEITIMALSAKFYVSRATILSDLDWASQWLAQYKLKLFKTQHRGVSIMGDEVAHRNAIAGFFATHEAGVISNFDSSPVLRRLDEKNLQNLSKVYPRDTILKIGRIIEDAEREFDFILLDNFYTTLLTHMVISVERIKNGNSVQKEFLPPDEDYPPLETSTAEFIAKRLHTVFGFKISKSEKAYICIHLIGYNAFSVSKDWNLPFPQKVEHLAISIIEDVDRQIGTEYRKDRLLFMGLCLHLQVAVYRLKVTAYTNRSLSGSLPNSWGKIYKAVRVASRYYTEICGVDPDEEELIGVAYFFLLAERRMSCRVRALLVSNLGIVARMELLNELEQKIPELDITDSCVVQQYHDWPNKRHNFVITTEELEDDQAVIADLSQCSRAKYVPVLKDFITRHMLIDEAEL